MFGGCCCAEVPSPAVEEEPPRLLTEIRPVLEEESSATTSTPESARRAKSSTPIAADFECTLRKEGSSGNKLGLNLDYWKNKCIQIVGTAPGAVQRYNEAAPAGRKVMQHFFIVGVNGEMDILEMKALLAREEEVTLQIKMPVRQTVKVTMDGESTWGLRLLYQRGSSTCMAVMEVAPGVFQKYNQARSGGAQVMSGDFVESVNGVSGSAVQMFEELRTAKSVEMVFLRLQA